jgi:hypothetical protein
LTDDCNRYNIYGFLYRLDLIGENQFFCGRVTAGGGEALVFVNIGALPALVNAVEIHMDATFRAPPTGYYQLASVHVMSNNTVNSFIKLLWTTNCKLTLQFS